MNTAFDYTGLTSDEINILKSIINEIDNLKMRNASNEEISQFIHKSYVPLLVERKYSTKFKKVLTDIFETINAKIQVECFSMTSDNNEPLEFNDIKELKETFWKGYRSISEREWQKLRYYKLFETFKAIVGFIIITILIFMAIYGIAAWSKYGSIKTDPTDFQIQLFWGFSVIFSAAINIGLVTLLKTFKDDIKEKIFDTVGHNNPTLTDSLNQIECLDKFKLTGSKFKYYEHKYQFDNKLYFKYRKYNLFIYETNFNINIGTFEHKKYKRLKELYLLLDIPEKFDGNVVIGNGVKLVDGLNLIHVQNNYSKKIMVSGNITEDDVSRSGLINKIENSNAPVWAKNLSFEICENKLLIVIDKKENMFELGGFWSRVKDERQFGKFISDIEKVLKIADCYIV